MTDTTDHSDSDSSPPPTRRTRASKRLSEIRKWADENGYEYATKNRLPMAVVDAWERAHQEQQDDDPLVGRGLLHVVAAAKALGLSTQQVYRLIKNGKITAIKHGNLLWIEQVAIDEYFARLRTEGAKRRAENAKLARQPRRGPRPIAIAG